MVVQPAAPLTLTKSPHVVYLPAAPVCCMAVSTWAGSVVDLDGVELKLHRLDNQGLYCVLEYVLEYVYHNWLCQMAHNST